MASSTRRAALGAILAAPLPATLAVAAPAVTPALARLIAKHDRINAILQNASETQWMASRGTMRAAGRARLRVLEHPSHGLPDLMAKAVCIARLTPSRSSRRRCARVWRTATPTSTTWSRRWCWT